MRRALQSPFAITGSQAKYPSLWAGIVGAWAPCLGPTGLTLRDWSGRANHGTLTNMTLSSAWSLSQMYSLLFDGSDDSVSLSASGANFIPTASPWTLSMWFNVDSTPSAYGRLAVLKSDSSPFHVMYSTDANYAFALGGTPWGKVWRFTLPSAGVWHHLFVSYNGAGVTTAANFIVLMDGIAQSINTAGDTIGAATNTSALGTYVFAGAGEFFKGRQDDIRIYSRALSASEGRLLASRRGISYELRERRLTKAPSGGRLLQLRRACA